MQAYKVGDFVIKDQRQYEIKRINKNNEIFLEDTFTKAKLKFSKRELNDFIFIGTAEIVSSDPHYNELNSENSKDFHSFSKAEKKSARNRHLFVKAYLESGIRGCSGKKPITDLIEGVAKDEKQKIISWRTLKRWVDAYDAYGIKGLVPKIKKKGNRTARKPESLEVLILEGLEIYKSDRRPKFKTAHEYLNDQVIIHNDKIENKELEGEPLPSLSYPSFINRAKKLAPASVLEAYVGKSAAYKKNRVARKTDEALYILDRAEIDHTGGDCFVVDDVAILPLGRPTVTAVLDKKSKSVLGAYIGFEAASFVSVARAMKHAISDKTEFLSQFTSVKGDWPCRGAFIEMAYDRGKEFESNLLEDALDELQITGRGNPAGMPWYKGAVESFFSTVNTRFLDNVPGKVFASLFDSNEYDPEKNAIIPLSDFLEAFYVWVVDVYMRTPHGTDKVVPYVSWKLDEKFVDIEPISPKKLELAFSGNLSRKNKDKGLVWDYIQYDDDLLLELRKQYGNQMVDFKLNRENLSLIHVLNPVDNKYYPVKAVDQEYTNGLTYFQHKVCRKYQKQLAKESSDEVSLAYARQEIRNIIDKAISSSRKRKISHTRAAARFIDLGQNKIGKNTLVADDNKRKPDIPSLPKGNNKPVESNSDFLKQFKE